jgi:hypothetical protein
MCRRSACPACSRQPYAFAENRQPLLSGTTAAWVQPSHHFCALSRCSSRQLLEVSQKREPFCATHFPGALLRANSCVQQERGYALSPKRLVLLIANPASFLANKMLIQQQREFKDKAKALLYMHETAEVFFENLDELRKLFRNDVSPKLHARRVAELEGAPERFFGRVEDTIREAALTSWPRDESSVRKYSPKPRTPDRKK